MSRIGLPVPPGFTVTTEVCSYYYGNKKSYPKALDAQVKAAVAAGEKKSGAQICGNQKKPARVSVCFGPRESMCGTLGTLFKPRRYDRTGRPPSETTAER